MAYGVEQQIGIGAAQVLPKGESYNAFVQTLEERKRYKDQQKRYEQEKKERDEKDLYGILGDAFNPKNFNTLIHDNLRKATVDLAAKLKGSNMSYGDVYLEARQKAGELGAVSDKLNKIDAQLSATKGEYDKFDKGLNTSAIEFEARKKVLNDLRSGRVDENVNYFDEALNSMTGGSLNYEGTTPIDFIPEEVQGLKGGYKKRNAAGVTTAMKWDAKVPTAVYDVKDNGDNPPTITIKSEKSGIKDANGNELPMLSEDAYRRWVVLPSKKRELYERVVKKYGEMPLRNPETEKLMRVEAYKDADKMKPLVNEVPEETQPMPRHTNNFFFGSGLPGSTLADYDILGAYSDRVVNEKIDLPIKADGQKTDFKETKELTIIPANQVAKEDRDLIKVSPITAGGRTFYIVRDDGNWEGVGGQVIYKNKVAQSNMDKTTENEARRGRTTLQPTIDKPTGGTNKRPPLSAFHKQ